MTEESEYEGKPVIVLKWREDSKYPFSFGLGKAKLILTNLEDIEAFVATHDTNDQQGE